MFHSRSGLFLGLGTVVVVLVFSGALAVRNTRQLQQDAAWVARNYEVLGATRAALTTVVDAETGQRGYLITSDPRYLEPYRAALARIRIEVERMKQLVQGDPHQRQRILVLEATIAAKLKELKGVIALHEKDPAAARREVLSHLGSNLMDSVRGQVEAMTREENAHLSERQRKSAHSYQVAVWSGTVTAVLGLAMVGVFLNQLLLHFKEREQSAAALIQKERDKAALAVHLYEAQQLETLGVLAGGVAHDFNNLLTSILGNANLGSLKAETGADVTPCFAAIEAAAVRAAELTGLLLAYAGKGKYLVTAVDLSLVAEETAATFSASVPGLVTLRCELAEDGTLVKGDAIQIRQILISLLANAIEAIGDGQEGRVSIRTGSERVVQAATRSECRPLPAGPGQYGTLEVADTGSGMPAEVLARAFEPFFSTKFAGRGLGLAAVLGILRSHEGGLEVRTAPGQGSTLKAFLPAMLQPGSQNGSAR